MKVKWIDLSKVGVHLGSYRDANKEAGIALLDVDGRHREAIIGLGFRPANGTFVGGLYLKPDHSITPAALRSAFGPDSVEFIVAEPAELNRQFNERIKEITRVNSNALFAQQRPLGMNHLGEIVQESIIGRYVIRQVEGKSVIVKEDAAQGAQFLRAVTKADLRQVAKGFVMRITARKEHLRREHVARLIEVSNNGDYTARDYQEAIEVGLNELFAEGIEQLAAKVASDPLATFDLANELYVSMPELKERTPNSIANQQYSTPLPMAALAQAMLGPREDLQGAYVLDPTIGNANLVSALNAGVPDAARCTVYGYEIDPARVEQVVGSVDQVLLGDVTKANLRASFNRPEGFDYVIANPPFGSTESKVEVMLPAGSSADSMSTNRLDHLILLNSLHARTDAGRAVFITGADSAIDNGEVKGRSKFLLNYLYDHYVVEGVVDISGELYKKQGAQYPLRMYVVGARRDAPVETAVPEQLDVIRTYEGLRSWADGVIAAQESTALNISALIDAGAAEAANEPVVMPVAQQAQSDDLLGANALRAVVTHEVPFDNVPAGWVVMNAPRPLLGQQTVENGEFLHGRFYAAIDPSDGTIGKAYFDRNVRDDGRMVFVASTELQRKMAFQLVPGEYHAAYAQMPEEEQVSAIAPFMTRLNEKTYGELAQLAADALRANDVDAAARITALEKAADGFGADRIGYAGVVPNGHERADDFMPFNDNIQMAMILGRVFKSEGAAFAIQVKDSATPYRVIKALYDDGRGVGSQWAETPDIAFQMVEFAPAIERAPDGGEAVLEVAEAPMASNQAILRTLLDIGWEDQGRTPNQLYWIAKTIDGGYKGMVNPLGNRRLSAKAEDGVMRAMHGDRALVEMRYDAAMSLEANVQAFDHAVMMLDSRYAKEQEASATIAEAVEPIASAQSGLVPVLREATVFDRAELPTLPPVLDLQKKVTGWKQLSHPNGDSATLISVDGASAVEFHSRDRKSGAETVRLHAAAHGYAIDHPYAFDEFAVRAADFKRLFSAYSPSGNISVFSGPAKASVRAHLMAVVMGVDKVPQAKAGFNALRDELFRFAGISTELSLAAREASLAQWITGAPEASSVAQLQAPVTLEAERAPAEPATVKVVRERAPFGPPPIDGYTVEKSALNSVKLRPLVGKAFSDDDVAALASWFEDSGWTSRKDRNFVYAVGPVDASWRDVVDSGRVTKKAMQDHVKEVERADKKAKADAQRLADLARLDSSTWIDNVFGADAMGSFNKAALAKYLDGEVESFEGLTNHRWSAGLVQLGISDEAASSMSVEQLCAKLKSAYEDQGRSAVVEAASPVDAAVVAGVAAEPHVDIRQESEYQQRYIAFSNVSEPDTMIPANLSGPIYEALSSIKAAHGDIDTYVARELDFAAGDLSKYFKAEQVDALAMIFHANSRGLGFLLGDKMGVGKGRVLAGVARRERLKGRIPVFVTVTPSLFSDFLERDVAVIGSRDLFANPLIINDGCKTVDDNGDIVVKALPRPAYKRYAERGELPEGTDMIMFTYSQIARRSEKSLTSRYLRDLAGRYPLTFLLDESHNGAGASNTSENLEAMIDAIGRRGSVIYSSGTAIKGAKNLRLYKKILPTGIDHEELLAAVESDPLSLQEALNYEIAAQGCMISRELDNTGIDKQYVMTETVERNHAIADQVADIFSAMCYLSGDVNKVVGKMNKDMRKELEALPEDQREGNRMGASSMNFGSRLHELNRQFLMAIKASDVVKRTLKALDENKKPIVTLQHTGESMLVDFVTKANEVYEDAPGRVKKELHAVIIDHPVSFRDLLNKYLEKISWIKIQGRYGDVSYRQADGDEIALATQRIAAMIKEMPEDLPLTPIDYLREELAKKGFTVAEISGRNLMARTMDDGKVSIEPVPNRADKTRINRATRDFNNGEKDVLVLTGSGSTGLSAQASPAVGRDVRVRTMIKWEMQPDIARERQMDGRHNRTGQIVLPEYEVPLAGLPADDRLSMMFNNKNRSLSSSTVANRDSKDIIRNAPDLLNEVGDLAAEDLLYENPELASSLDIQLPEDADERAMKGALWFCNKLSGRLSLLRVAEQTKVYAEWQSKFVEKLDRFKAEGCNPLEVECLDLMARVVSRETFMGAVQKEGGSKSSFNSPIYLTTVAYGKTLKAVRAEQIDVKLANDGRGLMGLKDNTMHTIGNYLLRNRAALLEKHRSKRFETIELALAAKEPNEVQLAAQKLDWMMANLPLLVAGAVFLDRDLESKLVPHVVVSYMTPGKEDAYARPSDYMLYTMQPGSDVVQCHTLSTLFSRGINFEPKNFVNSPVIRAAFDDAENGEVTCTARLFDGNLFEATALNLREKLGRKIVYTDSSGARQHGILLRSDLKAKELDAIPEKVRDVELLVRLLDCNAPLTSDSKGNWREPGLSGIVVQKKPGGIYSLSVPGAKSRGGEIFLDPALSLIAGKEKDNKFSLKFSANAGKMVAAIDNNQLNVFFLGFIKEKNINFYFKDRTLVRQVRDGLGSSNEQRIRAE